MKRMANQLCISYGRAYYWFTQKFKSKIDKEVMNKLINESSQYNVD